MFFFVYLRPVNFLLPIPSITNLDSVVDLHVPDLLLKDGAADVVQNQIFSPNFGDLFSLVLRNLLQKGGSMVFYPMGVSSI
jgi:hypothetical protein